MTSTANINMEKIKSANWFELHSILDFESSYYSHALIKQNILILNQMQRNAFQPK
jgi:hypothetical protein